MKNETKIAKWTKGKSAGTNLKMLGNLIGFTSTYSRNMKWNMRTCLTYRKTSNISRTLVGNKIVDNSDHVGASPVGAAPTTSSFST